MAVVEGNELVAQGADFAVEGEAFEVEMRAAEHGEAGGFITASGFEADEAVFDNVHAADAMAAGDCIAVRNSSRLSVTVFSLPPSL